MAQNYLFFRPAHLPLETGDLRQAAVLQLQDSPYLRTSLEQAFPGLSWQSPSVGQATVAGNWYELHLPQAPTATLALRCSREVDHSAFVQDLCNRLGWLAFNERALCFQPQRDPPKT